MLKLIMVTTLPVQELTEFQYIISKEMFVPATRHATLQELGGFVLATYAEASIERNEDLDAMLIGDAFRFLPMSEEHLVDIAARYDISNLAESTLEAVNRETDEQINNSLQRVGHVAVDKQMLAAADVLAQDSVAGEPRRSGRPYHSHLFRVAARGFYVAQTLQAEDLRDNPALTDAEIILRLHHDSPEETMPAGKHYNPHREGHYSPLLILRLLERFDNPYARPAADGLRYTTHLKGMPWMRDWKDYVHHRVMMSFMATMTKDDDIFDNRHGEPKPADTDAEIARRDIKHADYDELTPLLRRRALELAPTPADISWIRRANDLRAQMTPGLHPENTAALSTYIYGQAA